ncbi:MAG TPA: hypothetical protein VFV17_02390 [Usitatibacteraceae bacterium]|nr:hypothetical protein [Usitatibacteraceae bacterium]
MVICPIAIVAGCAKCPAFKVCPAKSILGDQKPAGDDGAAKKSASATGSSKKKT